MSKYEVVAILLLNTMPFLIIGIIGLMREKNIKRNWELIQGTIVELRNAGGSIAPVVEYYVNGEKLRVKSLYSSRGVNSFNVGERVDIYINPDKPKKFRIEKDNAPIFLWGIFSVIGGIGVLVCGILFLTM